jgi:peroxiredoxin
MVVRHVHLADLVGMVCLLNVVNSLEWPLCQLVTRRWEALCVALPPDACIYTVSMDPPQMQARWQESAGVLHQAQRNFTSARQSIASLASTIDDVYLREHFLRAALATLPREKPVSVSRVAKEAFGGLTEREREVAALIAQEKSNREIADELVVSYRTVETHVGTILSKLAFSSRAQIAV